MEVILHCLVSVQHVMRMVKKNQHSTMQAKKIDSITLLPLGYPMGVVLLMLNTINKMSPPVTTSINSMLVSKSQVLYVSDVDDGLDSESTDLQHTYTSNTSLRTTCVSIIVLPKLPSSVNSVLNRHRENASIASESDTFQ